MIKLKSLIEETKKLNPETNPIDAAEYIIRQVWKVMPRNDRFSYYQLSLWLDNERPIAELKEKLALKFFPSEKYPDEKFSDVIEKKLEELESEKDQKRAKKIDKDDPLFILKNIVRNKTYDGAKQSLVNNSIGSWGYKGGKIGDEEAENVFNRMYRNAMGETVYSLERGLTGKLSNIKRKSPSDKNDIDQLCINMFIDKYAGYNALQFQDKIKVYRGTNNPLVKIRPGDYVTFDKDYASSYIRGKFGTIISDILYSKDLLVDRIEINHTELIYWPEGHQIKKYNGHIPTFKEFWMSINGKL